MNKVEQLSDAELQENLMALGFPKVAVTETTRSILKNKLLKSKNKEIIQARHELGGLSPMKRRSLNNQKLSNVFATDRKVGLNNYPDTISMYSVPQTDSTSTKYRHISANVGNNMDDFLNVMDYSIHGSPESKMVSLSEHQSHEGVVSRLLSFRDKTFKKPKVCENNQQTCLSLSKGSNRCLNKSERTFYEFISYVGTQSRLNQSFKPYLLVSLFAMFFTTLAFIYMLKSPNNSEVDNLRNKVLICEERNKKTNCIPAMYIDGTMDLLKNIMENLQIRSKQTHCNNKKVVLTETDILKSLEKIGYYDGMQKWRENLFFAKRLIEQNPQWKVVINSGQNVSYSLSDQNVSLFCSFYSKIKSFFVIIGIGSIIVVFSVVIYTLYRNIKAWRLNRSNVIEQFTTDIVNELIYRASLSEAPEEREVVTNHLRDKIIPLNKRNSYLKYWNEALKVLETNDSRIQFGFKIIDGTEYHTMAWISNATNGLLKKWQSPAFGYANKINKPPTSCLKIRHMFDSTESDIHNLKQIIESAIIEKVGSRCCIQDIQIDKKSCCVYVRCCSEFDAGVVHNEINGWWFDKRLISIKFLRLQRYLTRFPDSKSAVSALTP
uniref:Inner nuclear membrane protein Man1 n=1 Tax=Zeugodacus cucurbitae TaxID=28588 RepID=A0A0A1WUL5_ZEUCU